MDKEKHKPRESWLTTISWLNPDPGADRCNRRQHIKWEGVKCNTSRRDEKREYYWQWVQHMQSSRVKAAHSLRHPVIRIYVLKVDIVYIKAQGHLEPVSSARLSTILWSYLLGFFFKNGIRLDCVHCKWLFHQLRRQCRWFNLKNSRTLLFIEFF